MGTVQWAVSLTVISPAHANTWKLCFGLLIPAFILLPAGAYGLQGQANPCLAPTPEDYSRVPAVPAKENSTLPDNIIPDVRNGIAVPVSGLEGSKVLPLEIVLNPRNQGQFANCLDSINDPTSPNYHHFLNASTILPYLPTPGQKLSVISFFTSHGYQVTDTSSPFILKASAPVSTHESTLGIKIRIFKTPVHKINYSGAMAQRMAVLNRYSEAFYAPDSPPTLPSNIASLIGSISGLDNYTFARPLESPCTGPYCPQGIQEGYMFSKLQGQKLDGSGQNVAIVDCAGDPDPQKAVDTYDQQYGLPPTTLKIFYPDGTPSSYDAGWASETMMDVEAVHTVAPMATIDLIYVDCSSGSPMDGIDYATTNHIAGIVTDSWGLSCSNGPCADSQLTPSLVSSSDKRLALDSAQGETILFASGDEGATADGSSLGTGFPASDPNVLAVGATELSLAGCGVQNCTAYGSETGSQISGGGYSSYFSEPRWQTAAIGAKAGRGVPDVSILGYKPSFWVYSTKSDKCGTAFFSTSGWFGCAGTSLSSPLWAGYLAIVQQSKGGVLLGNVAPVLYGDYNATSYACSFHDITSGNNIMSGSLGYSAGPGWDPVTGLGTPISDGLVTVFDGRSCAVATPEFGPWALPVFGTAVTGIIALVWRTGQRCAPAD